MSNIIPFNTSAEVPAHLLALFGDDSNIAPRVTTNQLSYRGRVWRRIVDGEESQLTRKDQESGDSVPIPIVNLVVLDHNKGRSRAFYEGGFEEGKNSAPRCSSIDGVKPDASIKDPCAATCATCPNAVKGSKITENQKQTTACSPFKRIAVVPSQLVGKHVPMLLRLAQTSVWDKENSANEAQGWYAWDQFLDMLRARGALHTAAVETKVKFDLRVAYPKLLFQASRWLNVEEAEAAKQQMKNDAEDIGKILNGSADKDGVTGSPGIPNEGLPGDDAAGTPEQEQAAQDQAAAATAAAAASAKAENEKKAAAKVARQKKAQEAAEAAAAAAEAARVAAAAAEGEEADSGAWGAGDDTAVATKPATAATTKPAAAAATAASAAGATVVANTPAGLTTLLENWDDNE